MAIHVESITTKFGTARLYNGYWRITSSKEGNHLKSLHRLIYENSVDIKKLEAKVKAKGLPWFKLEKRGNHV